MKIGTSVDDSVFRNKIKEEIQAGTTKFGQIKNSIDTLKSIDVSIKAKPQLDQKAENYSSKLDELFRRYKDTVN
jgi:vacuolar-type H+-ATPase subunit I/STV1